MFRGGSGGSVACLLSKGLAGQSPPPLINMSVSLGKTLNTELLPSHWQYRKSTPDFMFQAGKVGRVA